MAYINFEQIVLKYNTKTEREHYEDHLIRSFKETKGYSAEEFFAKCEEEIIRIKKKSDKFFNDNKIFFNDFDKDDSTISRAWMINDLPIKYNDISTMQEKILLAKSFLLKSNHNFRQVLKIKFNYNEYPSYKTPNFSMLDKVLSCIDNTYNKVDFKDFTECLHEQSKIWLEITSDSSIEKYFNLFCDQLIWLNTVLEKKISSSNSNNLNNLFHYSFEKHNNEHQWLLSYVSKDGIIKFHNQPNDYELFVNDEILIKLLSDLHIVVSNTPNSIKLSTDKTAKPSIDTNIEGFRENIKKFGFFDLEKIKTLNIEKRDVLVKLLYENKIPYKIAMFEFLGFIQYLNKSFNTNTERNIEISKWFDSDIDGRRVKGNIDNVDRKNPDYTSYNHKEKVKKDYEGL